LESGPTNWRITDCKLLSEHLKAGRVALSGGPAVPGQQ